jgi:hypothetical protein
MNILTKTVLGLWRSLCWKDAQTWDERQSRKMSARVMFIMMISALVFLSCVYFAQKVVCLFSSVHLEKLGTSGINRGNGANAIGYASVVRNV